MARVIPSQLPLTNQAALSVSRRLIKLPDERYTIWAFISRAALARPEFLIVTSDNRAALLSVSPATPEEAQAARQPSLFGSLLGRKPAVTLGERELGLYTALVEELRQRGVDVRIPYLLAFPNLDAAALTAAAPRSVPAGVQWLGKEMLRSEELEPWLTRQLSRPLSEAELGHLRELFTPEAIVPAGLTVRTPVSRDLSAQQTAFLLDYDQEWAMKLDLDLSPEAQSAAQGLGLRLINGVAGSGKSLIILNRAWFLRQCFPEKRILMLTHNRPLSIDLQQRYRTLSGGDTSVEVRTFFSWCSSLMRGTQIEIVEPADRERLLAEVHARHLADGPLSPATLGEEFLWIKDRRIWTREDYLQADRRGRGVRLTAELRGRVLDALEDYQGQISSRGLWDWEDLPRFLWRAVHEDERQLRTYDIILIDEAQFFAPLWFDLIKLTLEPERGHLFMVADPTQGFLKRRQSWLASGLDVRGRSLHLGRSYRTTRQLLEAATKMYQARLQPDEDDLIARDLSAMPEGEPPRLVQLDSEQDEQTLVVNEVVALRGNGVPGRSILIIHENSTTVGALVTRLNAALGTGAASSAREPHGPDAIRVCSLNAATGLESPIVFLMGLHRMLELEGDLQRSPEERAELVAEHARKLYMALTRAGQRLIITYVGTPPAWLRESLG